MYPPSSDNESENINNEETEIINGVINIHDSDSDSINFSDSSDIMEIDDNNNNNEDVLIDISEIINNTESDNNDSDNNESDNNDNYSSDESTTNYINLTPSYNLDYFFNNPIVSNNIFQTNTHTVIPFNLFNISTLHYINSNEINDYIINIIHEDDILGEWNCEHCQTTVNVINKCCDTIYKWKCRGCEHSNDINIIRCSNCDLLKKWNCSECDFENNVYTAICLNCISQDENVFELKCEICNETNIYKNRFICPNCNQPRTCQCNYCINNNLFIPYTIEELSLDEFEFEDVERNIGLTEEELNTLPQINWTSECKYDICTICINTFSESSEKIYELNCEHKHCFHKTCLNDWLNKQNSCPNCRFKLTDR